MEVEAAREEVRKRCSLTTERKEQMQTRLGGEEGM